MVTVRSGPRTWQGALLAAVLCGFCASASRAIDDPEAPDLMGAFESRARVYEERAASAGSIRETTAAYAAYERFLDGELQRFYLGLASRLGAPEQQALTESQQRWLAWRDAEFRFVDRNWTAEQFGTSAALSRGAYRTSIVKQRAIMLLNYLKNYR